MVLKVQEKALLGYTCTISSVGSNITGLAKDIPFRVTMNGDLGSMNMILFRRFPVVK